MNEQISTGIRPCVKKPKSRVINRTKSLNLRSSQLSGRSQPPANQVQGGMVKTPNRTCTSTQEEGHFTNRGRKEQSQGKLPEKTDYSGTMEKRSEEFKRPKVQGHL